MLQIMLLFLRINGEGMILQRIREACKQGSFKLFNVIEVDETYIGGKEANKHVNKKLKKGRGAVDKTAVFGRNWQ